MRSSAGFRILSGTSAQLGAEMDVAMARYRYRVFVQHLGWRLPGAGDGMERDQFDRPDMLYLLARRPDGAITGMARLLPTLGPYLLGEVFPQLMHGRAPPRSARVWELSRFAAFDPHAPGARRASNPFLSPLTVALLRAALRRAAQADVQHLITVSPPGIGRLLVRAGVQARAAGQAQWLQGQSLVAYWIATGQESPPARGRNASPLG